MTWEGMAAKCSNEELLIMNHDDNFYRKLFANMEKILIIYIYQYDRGNYSQWNIMLNIYLINSHFLYNYIFTFLYNFYLDSP